MPLLLQSFTVESQMMVFKFKAGTARTQNQVFSHTYLSLKNLFLYLKDRVKEGEGTKREAPSAGSQQPILGKEESRSQELHLGLHLGGMGQTT